MPSISVPGAILASGAIAGGAGILGGVISGNAAKSAAQTQANAAMQAAQLQQQQYETTRSDLMPYMNAGAGQLNNLLNFPSQAQPGLDAANAAAAANIPGKMTQAELLQTPGYQFALTQGQKALNNSFTRQGAGTSGSVMKAGVNFATGLADQTYQTQFGLQQQRFTDYIQQLQNQLGINNQLYGMYQNATNLGEAAAAKSGTIGQAGAAAAGTNIAGAGQALGAGIAGQGAALGKSLSNLGATAGNALTSYAMWPYLFGNNPGGLPTNDTAPWDTSGGAPA